MTALHDKDGWLGAIGLWQRLEQQGSLPLRVWQSTPADRLAAPARDRPAQRRRLSPPPARLPEDVHGRDARLADGLDGRRQRRRDHDRRGARGDRARGRRGGLARRRPRDRRRSEHGGARRLRALARRLAAARPAPADRARAVPRARGRRRASPSSGSPCPSSSPTRRPTRSSRSASGPTASTGRTRSARSSSRAPSLANGSDAPVEELEPWAGVVAARPRPLARGSAAHPRAGAPRGLRRPGVALARRARRGTLVPGRYADLVVLDRDPFACEPEELREVQVVATMLGGRWTHNPPPWD